MKQNRGKPSSLLCVTFNLSRQKVRLEIKEVLAFFKFLLTLLNATIDLIIRAYALIIKRKIFNKS